MYPQDKVNVALFGTGGVANMHARAMQKVPQAQLLGAYSRSPDSVEKVTRQYHISAFSSLDEILQNDEVDAVIIASSAHHVYSMLYLVGRPVRISAVGSNIFFDDKQAMDQVSIQAELANGVIVNLWGSFGVDDKTNNPWSVYYKVLGTEGGFSHSWNDLQMGEATQPGWDLAGYQDSFEYSQAYFINQCITEGKSPLSNLHDTMDAFNILMAAELAMAERRWIDVQYSSLL